MLCNEDMKPSKFRDWKADVTKAQAATKPQSKLLIVILVFASGFEQVRNEISQKHQESPDHPPGLRSPSFFDLRPMIGWMNLSSDLRWMVKEQK